MNLFCEFSMNELEQHFVLGDFQLLINQATTNYIATLEARNKLKARVLLFRAYVTQARYSLVIQDISPKDPDVLIAIQLLAMFLGSNTQRKQIVIQVDAIASQITQPEPDLAVVLSTIFALDGNYDKALEVASRCPNDLECVGLMVQLYCLINRPDLAQKEIIRIRSWAQDSLLSQIIETWYGLYTAQPLKSFYLYEQLSESPNPSARVLCNKGACLLQLGKAIEAETTLLEALSKNPNDVNTLANLVVSSYHLNKNTQVVNQYLLYFSN
jgi:coatomer protein complex subunit epsilon